jgi:dTDP-4-dehydrorhamnose reductase
LAAATAAIVARLARDERGVTAAMTDVAGTYHLTAGGETTWHGFTEELLRLDPRREEQTCKRVVAISSAEYPTPARRPANSRLDCDRAASCLGVRIPDWKEQLALVLAE